MKLKSSPKKAKKNIFAFFKTPVGQTIEITKFRIALFLILKTVGLCTLLFICYNYVFYKNEASSARQYIVASSILKQSDSSSLDERALDAIRKIQSPEYRARLLVEAGFVFSRSGDTEKAIELMNESVYYFKSDSFVEGVEIKKIEALIRSKNPELVKRYDLEGMMSRLSYSDSVNRFYVRELSALYKLQNKNPAGFESDLNKIIKDASAPSEIKERAQKLLDAKPKLIQAQREFEARKAMAQKTKAQKASLANKK